MGLLKGIDPLLTADLLYTLRSMGHGDRLVVCDCNFPAAAVATKTISKVRAHYSTLLSSGLNPSIRHRRLISCSPPTSLLRSTPSCRYVASTRIY